MGWNGTWKTKGRPSEARLKFFDETFLQKSFDLALDLHRRAAQERKLGKQRSVFPGRPSAWALNSRPWQLAAARAHQAASARARGLHPWQFAARGRAGQFTPWSGELRSRLCKPPAHVRAGGCAWTFLRPRTLYFTGPALDFCEFSLNFPCIFGKIGIRKQPLSQIFEKQVNRSMRELRKKKAVATAETIRFGR